MPGAILRVQTETKAKPSARVYASLDAVARTPAVARASASAAPRAGKPGTTLGAMAAPLKPRPPSRRDRARELKATAADLRHLLGRDGTRGQLLEAIQGFSQAVAPVRPGDPTSDYFVVLRDAGAVPLLEKAAKTLADTEVRLAALYAATGLTGLNQFRATREGVQLLLAQIRKPPAAIRIPEGFGDSIADMQAEADRLGVAATEAYRAVRGGDANRYRREQQASLRKVSLMRQWETVVKGYPNARFVVIPRERVQTVRDLLWGEPLGGPLQDLGIHFATAKSISERLR